MNTNNLHPIFAGIFNQHLNTEPEITGVFIDESQGNAAGQYCRIFEIIECETGYEDNRFADFESAYNSIVQNELQDERWELIQSNKDGEVYVHPERQSISIEY